MVATSTSKAGERKHISALRELYESDKFPQGNSLRYVLAPFTSIPKEVIDERLSYITLENVTPRRSSEPISRLVVSFQRLLSFERMNVRVDYDGSTWDVQDFDLTINFGLSPITTEFHEQDDYPRLLKNLDLFLSMGTKIELYSRHGKIFRVASKFEGTADYFNVVKRRRCSSISCLGADRMSLYAYKPWLRGKTM